MERLLGIDFGQTRVGLALSDPLGMFATGLTTLTYTSISQLITQIQSLLTQHEVMAVVIGLPLSQTGEEGKAAIDVRAFGQALGDATGISITYVDERFTSVIAQQSLRAQGIQPSRQKGLVDQTAAALILQQYLDRAASPPPTC
jgi:putative Holliday junction resolvase